MKRKGFSTEAVKCKRERCGEEGEQKFVQSFRFVDSWCSLHSFGGMPDMSLHRCDALIDRRLIRKVASLALVASLWGVRIWAGGFTSGEAREGWSGVEHSVSRVCIAAECRHIAIVEMRKLIIDSIAG
jgi:hypothetical protein